jgi:uncharacterized protein with PIN domain
MAEAYFRFYAELNDFLPPERRTGEFVHRFEGRVSVKDMIESLGVPHTEVDLILANGRSVDFTYLVAAGDRISVYPMFESLDISPLLRVRPEPLRHPRFVLDQHLGRLAAYLRLLGFDALYRNDYDDEELARVSHEEGRILLTRDRGLLKRKQVTRGYCVRSTASREQIREVVRRFDLAGSLHPFTRCVHCNGRLHPVAKEDIVDQLLPHTREQYDEFRACEDCGQVYWEGSHHRWLRPFLESLRELPRRNS